MLESHNANMSYEGNLLHGILEDSSKLDGISLWELRAWGYTKLHKQYLTTKSFKTHE